MTDFEIIEKFNKTKTIFGYKYGHPQRCIGSGPSGMTYVPDEIREMTGVKLSIDPSDSTITYIWGWPANNYTTFKFSDYGKTWAFTPSEISEYPYEYVKIVRCNNCRFYRGQICKLMNVYYGPDGFCHLGVPDTGADAGDEVGK